MYVTVSTSLFDEAMSYAWNAVILQLRTKMRDFGLPIVAQILQLGLEEKHPLELQDDRLLKLAFKLDLVNEDGLFFLGQCREVRNSFSAAHPTMGNVNGRESTTFLDQCARYALADASSPRGMDIRAFIPTVKSPRFNANRHDVWVQRPVGAHNAQH